MQQDKKHQSVKPAAEKYIYGFYYSYNFALADLWTVLTRASKFGYLTNRASRIVWRIGVVSG